MQVMWGLPGLRSTRVADAVAASCALPGIFPPREINGRAYVDGAVVENLPVRLAASLGQGPILAINVAATSVLRSETETRGFAATYIRGLEIVMQTQIEAQLRDWKGPPLVLVQPRVEHISMFAFDKTAELIEAGYRATAQTLDQLGTRLSGVTARHAPDPAAPSSGGRVALRGLRQLCRSGASGVPARRAGQGRGAHPGTDLVSHRWRLRAQLSDRTRSACVRKTRRPDLEDEHCRASLAEREEVAERAAVVRRCSRPRPRAPEPARRAGLVVRPLVVRIPEVRPTGVVPTTDPPGAR